MGKKVAIILIMVILISVPFLGCLGGNDPGDVILGPNDIPGDWYDSSPLWSQEDYAQRNMRNTDNEASIWLVMIYYSSVEEAEQVFQDKEEALSSFIAYEPDLGDDCFLAKSDNVSAPFVKEVYCIVGTKYIDFTILNSEILELYSDDWVLDIVEMQISRL